MSGSRGVRRGSLVVELYNPTGHDPQQPHRQDEVYVVAEGSGTFVNGPERHPFGKGDVLFVPAGVRTGSRIFSGDLQVWVVFTARTARAADGLNRGQPAAARTAS